MSDFPELENWYRAKRAMHEHEQGPRASAFENAYFDAVECLERACERRMKLNCALGGE